MSDLPILSFLPDFKTIISERIGDDKEECGKSA